MAVSSTTAASLGEWLNSVSLDQYFENFESEGYDDLEFLVKLGEDEVEDLIKHVGMSKAGHVLKLKKSLDELRRDNSCVEQLVDDIKTEKPSTSKLQSTLKLVNGRFVLKKQGVRHDSNNKPWSQFIIPNPHSRRLKFFNSITDQLYKSAFHKLQSGFRQYLKQQQLFRWEANQEITQMEAVLEIGSNNGLDLNVQKYKKELPLSRPVALDVEKCHTTLCKLSALEEKLSKIKTRLQTRKNSLYDENHVPKQWASDELEYLDLNLKKLTQLQQNLTSLHSSVSHTYKFLSSRFNRDTVVQEERKRVARGKRNREKK